MPNIDPTSFIMSTFARYNGESGNLILSADGIWFVPDDGGAELHIPIEQIMDANIEGKVRKRVCVMTRVSNDRHLFMVPDYESWRSSIALAAGIYRRIVSGTSGIQAQTQNVQPSPVQKPAHKPKSQQPQAQTPTPAPTTSSPAATAPVSSPAPSAAPSATKRKRAQPKPQAVQTAAPVTPAPSAPSATRPAYVGPWPSGQDYEQSFQAMRISMNQSLGDIGKWEPVKNPKTPGWYVFASGNYGSIYKVKDGADKYFALKCFTRNSENLNERYLKISDYLEANSKSLDFLAHFRYYKEGIKTRKSKSYYFPLLKMEWIDGVTLNKYIQANIDQPKILRKISTGLVTEIDKLQSAGVAHGDLAGDNIIVCNGGDVKLVDYDGMYIPDFKGRRATEMGHADFQHPGRTADSYSSKLDNFSALVIHLSLSAIAEKPALWEKYNGNDPDCLILRKSDFIHPDASNVLDDIAKIRNRKIRKMHGMLLDYLSHGPLWDGVNPGTLASF